MVSAAAARAGGLLVTVATGSGVINHYAGGNPISRTAAVIAPGAAVMAMIYVWGPLCIKRRSPHRAVTKSRAGCREAAGQAYAIDLTSGGLPEHRSGGMRPGGAAPGTRSGRCLPKG